MFKKLPGKPTQARLRFALYGHAAAGKTCYLAALAMPRDRNPRGYACDWTSGDASYPSLPSRTDTAANEAWLAANPDKAALATGRRWLEGAIDAMRVGKRPPPNDNSSVHEYHFVFRGEEWIEPPPPAAPQPRQPGQAEPAVRNYAVELIDYSGELVTVADDDEFTRRLRDHMREVDGLIVLAEASTFGPEFSRQSEMLHRMRIAFEAIRASKWDRGDACPVALVINKADRLMAAEGYLPSVADRRAKIFLEGKPEPPHASLRDALRAAVGPEHFRVFLSSAFGHNDASGNDPRQVGPRPTADGRLRSFGLEDPFMWMARQREDMLRASIDESLADAKPWQVWQVWAGRHSGLMGRIDRLAALTKESPAWRKAMEQKRWAARLARGKQAAVTATAALVLAFGGLTSLRAAWDSTTYHSYRELAARSDSTAASLDEARAWFENYQKPGLTRLVSKLFVLPDSVAAQEQASIVKRIADDEDKRRRAEELALALQRALSNNDLTVVVETLFPSDFDKLAPEGRALVLRSREYFGAHFEELLDTAVSEASVSRKWNEAIKLATQLEKHDQLRQLVNPDRIARVCMATKDRLYVQQEKTIYEDLRRIGSDARSSTSERLAAVRKYADVLRKTPAVKAQVESYEKYLDGLDTPIPLVLEVRAYSWSGGDYQSVYQTTVSVAVDNQPCVNRAPIELAHDRAAQRFANGGNYGSFTAAKSGKITVGIRSLCYGKESDPWATGEEVIQVADLARPGGVAVHLDRRGTNYGDHTIILAADLGTIPVLDAYEIAAGSSQR
ncbi:MAG: hypothetical protein QM770_01415 [Tepidisphaeraceae bacterium]